MNLHDTHYRKLFSSPHMVRALFQGILPASLQAMLDLDTLEPLPTNYISAFLQERRGDLVWRVRRRDGQLGTPCIVFPYAAAGHRTGSYR